MSDDLRAPFPGFGGKSRAAPIVWPRFGKVVNYVEPCVQTFAMGLACPEDQRPRVETINDINCYVSNFWRAVSKDAEAVAGAADWPVNETDLHARHRDLLRRGPAIRALLEDPHAFDVEAAGWWVWGASAWIGSGWCEEGGKARVQAPRLGGATWDGRNSPALDAGIHAAGMREPSRKLPELSGSTWRGEAGANVGRGIHAAGARGPSRQLPNLAAVNYGPRPTDGGKGIHSPERRTRLHDIFARLQERLRYTRVACGDWARITTPAVTYRHGLTAVFLDPPYPGHGAVYGSTDDITPAVRAWALDMGARKDMRICYCGYEGDAPELETAGWEIVAWRAKGGYGNQRAEGDNENAGRERLWFSPHCLRPGRDVGQLDMFAGPTS